MYAYGPVPSRRLGRSIGVSPIPPKVCSYSCVYCQLGRTSKLQAKRQRFFPKEDILQDIKRVLSSETADVITFVGDGEPTLCSDLVWLIQKAKQEFGLPTAVITNGSLLFHSDVQTELLAADIVIPTLDAGNPAVFREINRPHRAVEFYQMVSGLTDFRRQYDGQFWLEVMLVKNLNDSDEQLTMIQNVVKEIQPEKVFVMTPIRPPAEIWVKSPDSERVQVAQQMLANAVTVANREDGEFGITEFANATEAILEISARHPLRMDQAKKIEQKFAEDGTVERLLREKQITLNWYHQVNYINPVRLRANSREKPKSSAELAIKRINCCTFRVTVDSEVQKRQYRVILGDAYYNNLARGKMSKEQLLEYCFRYFADNQLLDQLEPKFILRNVCREQPEFEKGIYGIINTGGNTDDAN